MISLKFQISYHDSTRVLSGSPPSSTYCSDAIATLDVGLIELLDIRASQINGCLLCIRYCFHRATRANVPLVKLENVEAWRRASVFTPREKAALSWIEQLASTSGIASGSIHLTLKNYFDETQIAELYAYWKRSESWFGHGVIRCCIGASSSI